MKTSTFTDQVALSYLTLVILRKSVAALTAVSPAAVSVESASNLTISLFQWAYFVPGAVLLWNSAERTTTFVDSGHLTVAIPASDLVQSGTVTLVTNNPGSSNSNSVTLTVNWIR